jgi:HEAT repeat protein
MRPGSVIPLIRDSEKSVHDEAIFTAGRLGVKEALPDIKGLYESGVQERKKVLGIVPITGRDDLVKKLIEALSYLGDPGCKDIFRAALDDERIFYRRYAAKDLAASRQGADVPGCDSLPQGTRRRSEAGLGFALFRLGREEHLVELVNGGDQGSGT